jgi:hypothetical protein
MAELDAACAWINPSLALVAVAVALLDLAAAAQRWTVARPEAPPAPARIVTVAAEAEACPPALPPDLRDMAGRD